MGTDYKVDVGRLLPFPETLSASGKIYGMEKRYRDPELSLVINDATMVGRAENDSETALVAGGTAQYLRPRGAAGKIVLPEEHGLHTMSRQHGIIRPGLDDWVYQHLSNNSPTGIWLPLAQRLERLEERGQVYPLEEPEVHLWVGEKWSHSGKWGDPRTGWKNSHHRNWDGYYVKLTLAKQTEEGLAKRVLRFFR